MKPFDLNYFQVQQRTKCSKLAKFYSVYLASLDRLVDIMARERATARVFADVLHRMYPALYELGVSFPVLRTSSPTTRDSCALAVPLYLSRGQSTTRGPGGTLASWLVCSS